MQASKNESEISTNYIKSVLLTEVNKPKLENLGNITY
jgi:hypothetical protein